MIGFKRIVVPHDASPPMITRRAALSWFVRAATLAGLSIPALRALADVLLPADAHGPAPSAVGIADFFDEWLSAPYPIQQADRALIVPALGASESGDASFVNRFRELCLLGYYTSPAGMKDIGYVEPTPSQEWRGQPEVVLNRIRFAGKVE